MFFLNLLSRKPYILLAQYPALYCYRHKTSWDFEQIDILSFPLWRDALNTISWMELKEDLPKCLWKIWQLALLFINFIKLFYVSIYYYALHWKIALSSYWCPLTYLYDNSSLILFSLNNLEFLWQKYFWIVWELPAEFQAIMMHTPCILCVIILPNTDGFFHWEKRNHIYICTQNWCTYTCSSTPGCGTVVSALPVASSLWSALVPSMLWSTRPVSGLAPTASTSCLFPEKLFQHAVHHAPLLHACYKSVPVCLAGSNMPFEFLPSWRSSVKHRECLTLLDNFSTRREVPVWEEWLVAS